MGAPRFPPPGGPLTGYRDAGTPVPDEPIQPPVPSRPPLPRGKRVVATRPDDPEIALAKAAYPPKPLPKPASVAGTVVLVLFIAAYIVLNCAHCSSPRPQGAVVIEPLPPTATTTTATATETEPEIVRPRRLHPKASSDRDGDGISDNVDKCPDDPEDFDGFEDEDGCPDPDNDRDGIPDVSDKCPNIPETINGFEDDDGCPDVVPPKKKP